MCSAGSLSNLGLSISFLHKEYKVSAMPLWVRVDTHTVCVKEFTCIVNVHRSVFDSVCMCSCVCMRFLVGYV